GWEAVRRTVAEIGAEALDRPWQNPRTGSSGTVTATAMEPKAGGICRAFATTVNDVRGVRAYRGEACRNGAADWQIGAIVPEDSKLLSRPLDQAPVRSGSVDQAPSVRWTA